MMKKKKTAAAIWGESFWACTNYIWWVQFESPLVEWQLLSKFSFQHWYTDLLVLIAKGKKFYELRANIKKALGPCFS